MRGSALVGIVILTHLLEPSDVAIVVFAQAVVAYVLVVMDFGLTTAGISFVARRRGDSRPVFGAVLIARLVLGALGIGLISIALLILPVARPLATTLLLYTLAAALGAFDVTWLSQALGSTVPRAAVAALGGLVGLIVMVGLVLRFPVPEAAPAGTVVGAAAAALAALVVVIRRHGGPNLPSATMFVSIGRYALPLGLSSLLAQVYYNFDLILIGLVRPVTEVAIYGAVYKIVLGLQMISLTFASVSLSRYAAAYPRGDGSFEKMLGTNLRLLGTFAVPVAIGGTILAPAIVIAVFGAPYAAGAVPLALLLWAVLFAFLSSTIISALSATGRGWVVTRAILVGAIVNVAANVILIPRYGMVAAAFVTVLTEAMVLTVVALRLPGAPSGLRDTLRSLPPALAMGAGLMILSAVVPGVPVVVSIAVGLVLFVLAGLVLRSWPEEDRERVLHSLRAAKIRRREAP